MPMYGNNAIGLLRRSLRSSAGNPLPAVLSGSAARYDAFSGVTADTTNGGYKWAPETGTSTLVSPGGAGPDYSATALGGKPALLFSNARSLITSSPALSANAAGVAIWCFFVVQMASPGSPGAILLGNTTNGAPAIYITADGSIQILRANQATPAQYPAGTMPFNQRVELFYSHTSGGVHTLRINKVAQTATSASAGGYTGSASSIQIGRFGTTSATSDLIGQVGFVEIGLGVPPTGTPLTDYEASVYNRWVA